MIYLDYSATTPVNDDVLASFNKTCKEFIGNPNSLHKLGSKSKELMDSATIQIAQILNVKESEVIYTSGSSESNNLAIKGVALRNQNKGKRIISTFLEHPSVIAPLNYLATLGFDIEFVNITEEGLVDIEHLKQLLTDDTILVSIGSVNSEVGLLQPIEEIGKLLKNYPNCLFHVDMTQNVGKADIPLTNIDLATFSAHKFYGLKGVGCLIKKDNVMIEPLIHGGKSTTVFRSGTPALPLIVSISKALRLAYTDLDKKYMMVREINNYLKEQLKQFKNVVINSNQNSIPHVLNISVLGVKPETFVHALEQDEIYVSTQTACSDPNSKSRVIYTITKDDERAKSSIRISLSHLTTKEEIDSFINSFKKNYNKLVEHENN